ncbi:phosphoadenosine phosphosulfate reductase family protein [Patescibacteria group bacterium]|nr:phosphoadenosine phosphosulfate reductase family protein [Patescibacteria group bacterium]MBU1868570.1 phosphoadenosine phosphosulfate reductase family protein [Patescibacteria group bacterium]
MKTYTKTVPDQEKTKLQQAPIEAKIDKTKEIIKAAYEHFSTDDMAVAWTGGKDSTLMLWLVKQVADELGQPIPRCEFINEGDVFDEIWEFVDEWKEKWGLNVIVMHNEDVSKQAGGKIGEQVKVTDLNELNQREVERLGYKGEFFPYEPESFVGNHLMKTVMINQFVDNYNVKGYFAGIRWDEQEARADETYFSPREKTDFNPDHIRVFPILHFTEQDVWDAIHTLEIPYVKLYEQGYRSLGARVTTTKADEKPAWEQDLENTTERSGRRQDKENIMQRLRDLGYM